MKIDVYEDKQGLWRWRFVAKNGRIIADSSEGYATESSCQRALDMVLTEVLKYKKPTKRRAQRDGMLTKRR